VVILQDYFKTSEKLKLESGPDKECMAGIRHGLKIYSVDNDL